MSPSLGSSQVYMYRSSPSTPDHRSPQAAPSLPCLSSTCQSVLGGGGGARAGSAQGALGNKDLTPPISQELRVDELILNHTFGLNKLQKNKSLLFCHFAKKRRQSQKLTNCSNPTVKSPFPCSLLRQKNMPRVTFHAI